MDDTDGGKEGWKRKCLPLLFIKLCPPVFIRSQFFVCQLPVGGASAGVLDLKTTPYSPPPLEELDEQETFCIWIGLIPSPSRLTCEA